MSGILRFIDRISDWTGYAVSLLIYVMLGCLVYEVTCRYVFNAPTSWAHEFTAFCFGIYFMCSAAYALRTKRMIHVDIIYAQLPRRGQALVNVGAFFFFFIVCYTLIWYGGLDAYGSWNAGERSIASVWAPVLYPIKSAIPIGTSLLLLQGLADFVRELNVALTGRELEEAK